MEFVGHSSLPGVVVRLHLATGRGSTYAPVLWCPVPVRRCEGPELPHVSRTS